MTTADPKETKGSKAGLFVVLLLIVVFPLGYYGYFEYRKHSEGVDIKQLPFLSQDSLHAFEATAHTGQIITHDSLLGHIAVVDFFFTTCPGICPKLSYQMRRLQNYLKKNKNLKSNYRLVSFTVNPSVDTLDRLQEYAKLYDVDSSMWWLARGEKQEMYDLSTEFFKLPAIDVSEDSTMAEPFVHSERFVLLDRNGFIRGYYDGTDSATVQRLMYDIVMLDIQNIIDDQKIEVRKDGDTQQ